MAHNANPTRRKLQGYEFYREVLGGARYVVETSTPVLDSSESIPWGSPSAPERGNSGPASSGGGVVLQDIVEETVTDPETYPTVGLWPVQAEGVSAGKGRRVGSGWMEEEPRTCLHRSQ